MEKLRGSRLGPYEITASLGSGGMGEVYRAKDPRLKRDVAIKILPTESFNEERQKRFQHEAQAASALSHPNILVVYDIGTENGHNYIVSELVEGEPLRRLIQKGPISSKKLLDLALQIADGLAAAHQAGIVHRDLKPENIMITSGDRVKILDFGLAKITGLESASREDETISRSLTESGILQGTVPYMSPEQAKGIALDFRSDQFSFGSILYEMSTGKRPFQRPTAAQTLSAIISEEPVPISELNPKVPAPVRWLIERCLAKDPQQRYDSTRDLYRDLQNLRDHLTETTSIKGLTAVQQSSIRKKVVVTALLTAAVLSWAMIKVIIQQPSGVDLSSYRLTPLATDGTYEDWPSWSPDGKTITYVADVDGVLQVFTKGLTSPVSIQITNSSTHCNIPFWSPDGNRIYYFLPKKNELWCIGAAGGEPQLVIKDTYDATISPNGETVAFLRHGEVTDSLWISSKGKNPQKYTEQSLANVRFHDGLVRFSPDGTKIGIYYFRSRGEFWILPFPSGDPYHVLPKVNIINVFTFCWMPDSRRIVFSAPIQGNPGIHLFIGDTKGGSFQLITASPVYENGPSVSPDGKKIAYQQTDEDFDLLNVPLDGSSAQDLLSTSRAEQYPSWSPSGDEYLYSRGLWGAQGIWLRNVQDGRERPIVTQDDFPNVTAEEFSFPVFSPEGKRVAYFFSGGNQTGTWVSPIAGGASVKLLSGELQIPTWSPDGNWIASPAKMPQRGYVLVKMRVGGSEQPIVLTDKPILYMPPPQWSPTGNWISYPTTEGLFLISPDGQNMHSVSEEIPLVQGWSKDGTLLYVINRDEKGQCILSSLDILGSKKKTILDLGRLSPYSDFFGFSLKPDGKSFATSLDRQKGDIWILEGFDRPKGFFNLLFQK